MRMSPVRSLSLLALLAPGLAACTAGESEVAPPRYSMYYPTGVAMTGDESLLFVLSANSDLRYASGTVITMDLTAVAAVVDAWATGDPGACQRSVQQPATLVCPTAVGEGAASFVVPNGSAKLGNFGVDLGVQTLADGKLRVFTSVRGDPSITWLDYDPAARAIGCGETALYPACTERHRLDQVRNSDELGNLPGEPFYLYVDGEAEHVFVSHLTSGIVTLVTAPKSGVDPIISDLIGSLFAPQGSLGLLGATGMAARTPGDPNGFVYVSSPREARLAIVRAATGAPTADGDPNEILVRVPDFFFVDDLRPGDRNDSRALAFSRGGSRLYVVSRTAPQLLAFDVTETATGALAHQLVGRVEICSQVAALAVADMGDGERVYIPCFATGQVWVVDPDRLRVEAVIESGRGPNGIVAAPGRKQVLVTNYAEDTISVIDTRPGSPTENFTVVKLGVPRRVSN